MKLFSRAIAEKKAADKGTSLNFSTAISTVELMTDGIKSPLEKVRLYNYAMSVIREDFAAYGRTLMFRKAFANRLSSLFPTEYFLADGSRKVFCKKGKKMVSLQNRENILVVPWECRRLANILNIVYSKGFIADDNHKAYYYTEIDTVEVYSGNHSISAGIFFGTGTITADVFNLSEVFEHIDTDGENWINHHNGTILTPVSSVHIAVLYEIARQKFNFLKTLGHDTADFCRINGGAFAKAKKCYTLVCGMPHSGKTSFLGTMHSENESAAMFDGENFDILINQAANIVEESVCFGSEKGRMRLAHQNGYYVKMIFVGIGIEESKSRSERISRKTGNNCEHENVLLEKRESIKQQLPEMMKLCDSVELFDNENGFKRVAHWDGQFLSFVGNYCPDWLFEIHKTWLDSLTT